MSHNITVIIAYGIIYALISRSSSMWLNSKASNQRFNWIDCGNDVQRRIVTVLKTKAPFLPIINGYNINNIFFSLFFFCLFDSMELISFRNAFHITTEEIISSRGSITIDWKRTLHQFHCRILRKITRLWFPCAWHP